MKKNTAFHTAFTNCICNDGRLQICAKELEWRLNSQNMQPQAFHWDLSWTFWETPVIIVDDKNYLYIKHIDSCLYLSTQSCSFLICAWYERVTCTGVFSRSLAFCISSKMWVTTDVQSCKINVDCRSDNFISKKMEWNCLICLARVIFLK